MRKEFLNELAESLYIHRPLPLHRERSLEAGFPNKKVLDSYVLFGEGRCEGTCDSEGIGTLEKREDILRMQAPLRQDKWPEGASPDGDYTNFGTAWLNFYPVKQDWRGYNRLRFWVKPQIRGARILHVHAGIENVGEITIPDPYLREGTTVFDLKNGVWQECIWEFAVMPRDAVKRLRFHVLCGGHDIGAGETLCYDFRDIRLEQVELPEHELGWENPNGTIHLSSVGYWPASRKTAVTNMAADAFRVVDAETEETVFESAAEHVNNERGSFRVLDFTPVSQPGSYYLLAGDKKSCTFEIGEDIARESLWKVVNFFFCERCGFPVPGKHGTCHQDIIATHNGETISFGGGWHDAGDVSQQAVQTGEVVLALFENARNCRNDRLLYLRLMEEAQWGLDFILRTRFGDGFRATSAGATRITDNRIGNFDDVITRVHDHSFENFLFAGIEAHAAHTLRDYDAELASNALNAAMEDFAFAEKKFAQTGVEHSTIFEHTYNCGLSQYYAVITWAASCLYEATGEAQYAVAAREWAEKILACQETGEKAPISGFFYRDESHKAIVHFNHQSRDHQFMQSLEILCRTQPEAAEKSRWEAAMVLYGGYLKAIAGNTAPYGMLPAGIHKKDEWLDTETFPWLHVLCEYEQEKENYRQQLEAATDLGGDYVLRNFPIWFSFRGNAAVMLSTGKAASLLGCYFDDKELMQIAYEQMYWMWGKNPFGQSLIYGAGSNYCRQYGVYCGECVGEVPVGMETYGNEDVPYWPQNNNATFREVWVGSASRWLMLCADCIK